MPSISLTPLSGSFLNFAEPEEIMILRVGGASVREIARVADFPGR
ncbi:helix-turn-helix domain-containing protein [Nocardia sp. NBC_00403]